ncbi:hypothetical protein [Candidatus Pelagisphaera phototrophica]|uniref:hypothetical protein n=1 Tax=Candidatus Pelagisphaera phototrophica TaxID=2684113 RepID=UPI0019EDEC77|nr:hypothetical protein [Candidatus Pelagisphaera phototrophica]QXD33258.1 hypothetical protein GA004_06000 [Candidatus Pelagisphaera phototrophica]
MRLSFRTHIGLSFMATVLIALLSGCGTVHKVNSQYDTTIGKKRQTTNVYQKAPLPMSLNRVALLPMYKGRYEHHDFEGIEENFRLELVKRSLFEVVSLTPEEMSTLFPEPRYSSIEYLPTDLLTKLSAKYAIDGLLLLDVSYFKPYKPVGLGIRAKLLDGHTGEIVWAADEVFDASNPAVSNSARKYYKTESIIQFPLHNTQTILHSPNRFSKYVAHSLFRTIYLQKD